MSAQFPSTVEFGTGVSSIYSLTDLSTYVINSASGRNSVRIGNDIFVKKLKLTMIVYPKLFNSLTPVSLPHTGEELIVYFIKSKKSST